MKQIYFIFLALFLSSCSAYDESTLIRHIKDTEIESRTEKSQFGNSHDSVDVKIEPNANHPLELLNLTFNVNTQVDSVERKISTIHRVITKTNESGINKNSELVIGVAGALVAIPFLLQGTGNSDLSSDEKNTKILIGSFSLFISYISFAAYIQLLDKETTFCDTIILRTWHNFKAKKPLSNNQTEILYTNFQKDPLIIKLDSAGSAVVSLSQLYGGNLVSETAGFLQTESGKEKLIVPENVVEYYVNSYIQEGDWKAINRILEFNDLSPSVLYTAMSAYQNRNVSSIVNSICTEKVDYAEGYKKLKWGILFDNVTAKLTGETIKSIKNVAPSSKQNSKRKYKEIVSTQIIDDIEFNYTYYFVDNKFYRIEIESINSDKLSKSVANEIINRFNSKYGPATDYDFGSYVIAKEWETDKVNIEFGYQDEFTYLGKTFPKSLTLKIYSLEINKFTISR